MTALDTRGITRRGLLVGAGGLSLGALLAACTPSGAPVPQPSGAAGPFKGRAFIQNPAALSQTPFLVAREMGAFGDADLTLEEIALAPSAMPNGLVSNSAEFALTAVASNILGLKAQGLNPIAVAKVYTNNPNTIIVSNTYLDKVGVGPDDDIEDKLEALKGARFGASDPGTGTDVTVQFAMLGADARINDDYSMTYLHDIGVFLSAMQTDQIDAFAVSSPVAERSVGSGLGVGFINLAAGEVPALAGMPWTTLWMLRESAERNPDMVVSAIKGLNSALTLLNEEPDEAKSTVRGLFDTLEDSDFDPAWKNNLGAYDVDASFDDDSFGAAIDFYNFARTGPDLIRADPDEFYTNEYVEAARG